MPKKRINGFVASGMRTACGADAQYHLGDHVSNGVGVAPDDANVRTFGLPERRNLPGIFEGTGAGLVFAYALLAKGVERDYV